MSSTIKRSVEVEIEITDADIANIIATTDPITLVFTIRSCLKHLNHETIGNIRRFMGESISNDDSDFLTYLDRIIEKVPL